MPENTDTQTETVTETADIMEGIDDVVFEDEPQGTQETAEAPKETAPDKETKAEAKADSEATELDPLKILKGEGEKPEEGAETETETTDDGDTEVDGIKEPEFKTDASKEGWEALKKIAGERKSEISKIQAELESYKSGDVSNANNEVVKSLEAQLNDARTRLAQYDASHLPEFQAKYEKPISELTADMAELAQEFDVVKDVKWASFRGMSLKEASERISEIADGNTVLENALMNKATEIRKLHKGAQAELENAGEFIQKSNEQRLRDSKITFDKVADEFKDNWSPAQVPDGAGEDEVAAISSYNASVNAIRPTAEKIALEASGPEDIARVAMEASNFRHLMAHGLPRIGKVYQTVIDQQAATIKEQQSQLKGITAQDARVSGAATSAGSGDKNLSEMSHEEALAEVEL